MKVSYKEQQKNSNLKDFDKIKDLKENLHWYSGTITEKQEKRYLKRKKSIAALYEKLRKG